jgi:hypothetical protein
MPLSVFTVNKELNSPNFHSCKKSHVTAAEKALLWFSSVRTMNIRSGKRYSVEQIPQRQHCEGKVKPAQAASPTEALGDSCCGLLRGAVQPDLRCTLGPLELTFDLCPLQAKRRYSIAKRVDPGGGALVPERAADEQPARAGADYNGADSPPRCSLWPPLRTGTHITASTSGRHPPPACGLPTCTCLNTPG